MNKLSEEQFDRLVSLVEFHLEGLSGDLSNEQRNEEYNEYNEILTILNGER